MRLDDGLARWSNSPILLHWRALRDGRSLDPLVFRLYQNHGVWAALAYVTVPISLRRSRS